MACPSLLFFRSPPSKEHHHPMMMRLHSFSIPHARARVGSALRLRWLSAAIDHAAPGSDFFTRLAGETELLSIGHVDRLCQGGQLEEALRIVDRTIERGIPASVDTFACLLKGCIKMKAVEEGRRVHAHIVKSPFEFSLFLGNNLIDMYAKCGSLVDARQVFDKMPHRNVFSWTAIIAGYANEGRIEEAMGLFQQMQQAGVTPDKVVFVFLLKACANHKDLEQGRQIHGHITKYNFETDAFVGSALVNLYSKCGDMEDARRVFDKIQKKNVVSWNAMIDALTLQRRDNEVLTLYEQMQKEGVKPDNITLSGVLKACANMVALELGKQLHSYATKNGFESDASVSNALVEMYAKCGSINDAHLVFSKMHERHVVSWNAIIAGYAQQGNGKEALEFFDKMQEEGIKPDEGTFVCVLSACSHSGLVNEGYQYLNSMSEKYGITPTMEHYACMVDLLGRAGRLADADDFIHKMPIQPNSAVWMSFLRACRFHGNIELGRRTFELVEPKCAETYALLSSIYVATGKLDEVSQVQKEMEDANLIKEPGCSWTEVKNKMHAFLVGDKPNLQTEETHAELKRLVGVLEQAGYVSESGFVVHDLGGSQQKTPLCDHSEMLAICFGLMSTLPGTLFRTRKHLSLCRDGHNATKLISKIVGREIITKDANCFHHFKDGVCSCRDYW